MMTEKIYKVEGVDPFVDTRVVRARSQKEAGEIYRDVIEEEHHSKIPKSLISATELVPPEGGRSGHCYPKA